MNILVTGGAGFIGSNLVNQLLNSSGLAGGLPVSSVVTLDKLTYAGNRMNLEQAAEDSRHCLIEGDIGDAELVNGLLAERDIDVIIHLAAESHVDRSIDSPEEFVMTNVVGTFQLLEGFRKHVKRSGRSAASGHGKSLARGGNCLFLHVSTDEVFGSLGGGEAAFCEASPYSPNSPYSASKAGSDHLAKAYFHTYRLPVVTTNCSNNYGPHQFPEKLLPLMIRKILNGERLPIYGDGSNVRDWLYVGDHCKALRLCAWAGEPGETYLIGGRCEMSNLQVVEALVACVGELAPHRAIKPASELLEFVTDRPGHDQRYAIDPAKIHSQLGWHAEEDFASGLRKTVQWYLEHERWAAAPQPGGYRGQRLGAMA